MPNPISIRIDVGRMIRDRLLEAVGLHVPTWVQDRDEPPEAGCWRCSCGETFAPDGLPEFAKHLPDPITVDVIVGTLEDDTDA